jgi:mRNA interferase MazF
VVLEMSEESGLKVDSVLKLHRLTTIPAALIKRQLGIISSTKKTEVQKKLSELFDLK